MRLIKTALAAAVFFLICIASSCGEAFYVHEGEIVYSETCPRGYEPLGDKLILGVDEMYVIQNDAKYFASDDLNVVFIDKYGVAIAIAEGETTISVYLADDIRKDFSVEVRKAPKSIKLSEKSGTLSIGETHQLKASLTKSTHASLTWFSSAPDVVSVDQTGLVTAKAIGDATITCTTHNGLKAECIVTVTMPDPAKIDFFSETGVMYAGESMHLLYKLEGGYQETVSWSSDNPEVATVDEEGLIKALREGDAIITARASGGDVKDYYLIVEPGSSSIQFAVDEITVYEGGRLIPDVIIKGGRETCELVPMDTSIAQIDEITGEIVALKEGSVYILGVTPNFCYDEFLLTIADGPSPLLMEAEKNTLAVSETLETSLNSASYEIQYTEYTSSDYSVATVDEYGVITGTGEGVCVIWAECGGLKADLEITVLPLSKDIFIQIDESTLGTGEMTKAHAYFEKGTGAHLFSSSDPSVASVDEKTGDIRANAPGTCEITVSLLSGASARETVSVLPAPESVYLGRDFYTLAAGNRHLIAYGTNEGAKTRFDWQTTDSEIVYFEDGFLVCPGKTGSARITVKAHNGLIKEADVLVVPAPAEIEINALKLTDKSEFDYYVHLQKGALYDLSASLGRINDIEIFYTSTYPDIASVNEFGFVSAEKAGTAVIEVSIASGCTERVLVSVK